MGWATPEPDLGLRPLPAPQLHLLGNPAITEHDSPATAPGKAARRHDLDALRALAMLLGIALHGALSFVPFPWTVQDSQQHEAFGLLFFAVHGFRMPVFFVMSGFFTAMIWRRRGLVPLLGQRLRRVFLPCMLGLFTIVPAVNWVSAFVMSSPAQAGREPQQEPVADPRPIEDIWDAVRAGDPEAVDRFVQDGADVRTPDASGATLLHWAAVLEQQAVTERLLEAGADATAKDFEGGTPLHWAAFFGTPGTVAILLAAGADANAANNKGEAPLDTVSVPWGKEIAGITAWLGDLMGLDLDLDRIERDRPAIIAALKEGGARPSASGEGAEDLEGWIVGLFLVPVFHHLWFLWFLCWLVAGFALYAALAKWVGFRGLPDLLVTSPLRYAWLLPLTWLPQLIMRSGGESPGFGPDTSVGWLPFPHLLFYYGIFFFFGVVYHDSAGNAHRLGRRWWLTLPLGLCVVLPFALEFSLGGEWSHEFDGLRHPIGALLEVSYTWLMVFGLMGLFGKMFRSESPMMRYVSDSSYWLYLAHLPVILLAQWWVRDWPLSPFIKFPLVCGIVTGLLLLTYRYCVRYTWLGTLLNGPRQREEPARLH